MKRKRFSTIDNNNYMHAKNRYRDNPPDFGYLADLYPETFGKWVRRGADGRTHIEWNEAAAVRCLTTTLLYHDYGVSLTLSPDRLCPPLPNRLNYICWLDDFLPPPSSPILDIGTGASCIYPILGYKTFNWRFVGSDIDEKSLQIARKNIEENLLSDVIQLEHVSPCLPLQTQLVKYYAANKMGTMAGFLFQQKEPTCGPILSTLLAKHTREVYRLIHQRKEEATKSSTHPLSLCLVDSSDTSNGSVYYTASMCNPPFYDTSEDIEINPHRVCTGSDNEMSTVGGEVAFIFAMIYDSWILKERVLFYTTMVGKKSSLGQVVRVLKLHHIKNIRTTAFRQGNTNRWAVSWSYTDIALDSIPTENIIKRRRVGAAEKVCEVGIEAFVDGVLGEETEELSRQFYEQGDGADVDAYSYVIAIMKQRSEVVASSLMQVAPSYLHCSSLVVSGHADDSITIEIQRESAESIVVDLSIDLSDAETEELQGISYQQILTSRSVSSKLLRFKMQCGNLPLAAEDRALFHTFADNFVAEYLRTNRRWRRILAQKNRNDEDIS